MFLRKRDLRVDGLHAIVELLHCTSKFKLTNDDFKQLQLDDFNLIFTISIRIYYGFDDALLILIQATSLNFQIKHVALLFSPSGR